MLVRNLKCKSCGGIKINEPTTGYIYCDYCSSLIGFDIGGIHKESQNVFTSGSNKELQESFTNVTQIMAKAINENNADLFIQSQLDIKQIEFDLFPKRYSPKAKQPSYREAYMKYFEAFWIEMIEDDYFNKTKAFHEKLIPLSQKITTSFENNQLITVYDSAFEEYISFMNDYIKNSVEETLKMKCMELYPEPINPDFDVLYKQSIDAALQTLNPDTAEKTVKFLGLEEGYITVDEIDLNTKKCYVCDSELNVPVDCKSILCETCGNINDLENEKIQCLSCGAPISYTENDPCEYCGARHFNFKKEASEKSAPESDEKDNSGGFFKKLFS